MRLALELLSVAFVLRDDHNGVRAVSEQVDRAVCVYGALINTADYYSKLSSVI